MIKTICPGCHAEFPRTCLVSCQLQPHAMQIILGATAGGATLTIAQDPCRDNSSRLRGTLESHPGAAQPRYAGVTAPRLGELLVALAGEWSRSA
jgi:hypothetical protein